MDLSIVIPLFNEEESLRELSAWINKSLVETGLEYEVIFIDDGSKDNSWRIIRELSAKDPRIRGIRFRRNFGKSAALNEGFSAARGDVVITMDADLQDSPEEIPELHKMITEQGYDLVSGWKKKRHDPVSKTIPSKFFNWVTGRISGIKLHDFNCGLKAYNKNVVEAIDVYGEMHRFIPVMAKKAGFDTIGEKVVQHKERKFGKTKFGLERFINGFLDLLSILFVTRFGKRPMHLFGTLGTLMFLLGFILFLYIGGEKLYYIANHIPAKNIALISWFYVALTAMIIGTQLFLAGFLAELVSRNAPDRNHYEVKERV